MDWLYSIIFNSQSTGKFFNLNGIPIPHFLQDWKSDIDLGVVQKEVIIAPLFLSLSKDER